MIKLAHPIIEEDEQRAVAEALASGQLAQGARVAAFERAFAEYVGVRHAVAVNSGTAALHVALLAHGIGALAGGSDDDEVVVPAFSFAATANCVLQAGARPVFVDVREADFNIDHDAVEAAITPRTRAVIGVHMYGQMCDATALRSLCERRGIVFIEDAAQAVGATLHEQNAGTFGTGCFSFYATKNLTTGEGGMLTTPDDELAERARMRRSQGERTRYLTEELGWNYRMTEPAAALGLLQLSKLDVRNEQRRMNAARLAELLSAPGTSGATRTYRGERMVAPVELSGRRHVWHQYTIRVVDRGAGPQEAQAESVERERLRAELAERGIETAVFYPTPIHRQPLYVRLGCGDVSLPVAERLCEEVLSLPVHPALSRDDLEAVAAAVREVIGR
jgi:dTDP-4-amino-4,6-dideoxygalactose transaminase